MEELPAAPSQQAKTAHGILLGGLIGVSLLNYVVTDATNVLGLVVANTILSNSYVWNLITASFFETNPIKLAADAAFLFYIFSTVDYPAVEHFAAYLAVCLLSCTVLTSTYCILSYFATADPALIVTPMYGFGGVLVAILMYARQFRGRESVVPGSPLPISFHNLPALLLVGEVVLWALGMGRFVRDLPFVLVGTIMSWSYLRFYAKGPVSFACCTQRMRCLTILYSVFFTDRRSRKPF